MNSTPIPQPPPEDDASTMIDTLQQAIHRFSDHQDRVEPSNAEEFWTSTALPSLKDIVHRYAPVGLESHFEQLYGLLHPCLVKRESDANAAAFCLGHRGMGKGFLLDRCLQACQEEVQFATTHTQFRVVQVHGVLIPGNDVGLVVKDMLQQLSKAAFEERADTYLSPQPASGARKRPKQTPRVENMLRLRKSSFDSNLQLLSETLKLARVDQIPILVVLDEVDAYLGGSSSSSSNSSNNPSLEATKDRQLLLYHLLDRVATTGSNVCLVGLTQQLSLRKQLEKRIKSRMEGTSKEIFVGACPSMNALINVILSNVDNKDDNTKQLHQQLTQILTVPDKHSSHNSMQRRVWDTLEREYRMGRNIRWFNRIFSLALSLYRGEWMQYQSKKRRKLLPADAVPPKLEASHLLDALVAQGASLVVQPNNDKRKRSSHLAIMEGHAQQPRTAVDCRIQALLDLSAPQVALVLAARRILARDAQWNGEQAQPPPLTLARMLQEYSRFHNKQFNAHLLWMSFQELMDNGLIRPAMDHSGGGPFQYRHQASFGSVNEAEDVPLHLLVDTNRELMEVLQNNLLECSTALREWGRKTNT